METINNMASAARNSVFGESNSTNNTPSKKPEADPAVTQAPDQEPPSADAPGKGTPGSPFDPGNTPAQAQAQAQADEATTVMTAGTGDADAQADTAAAAAASSSTTTAASAPAADTNGKETDSAQSAGLKPAVKTKSGSAKPGSHSALFGLGEGSSGGSKSIRAPDPISSKEGGNGGTGPIEEEKEEKEEEEEEAENKVVKEAEKGKIEEEAAVKKRAQEQEEDEASGYMGLRKAAMEEEEKRRTNGGGGNGGGNIGGVGGGSGTHLTVAGSRTADQIAEDEDRDPRSMQKKNSFGRDISPGEMPDGTHRKSIADAPTPTSPSPGHLFSRKGTHNSNSEKNGGGNGGGGGGGGGFRDKLKDRFRSKK